jgi:streptomycin 6-kinase
MAVSAEKLDKGHAKLTQAKIDWQLMDDGEFFRAGNSLLQPVLFEHRPAMLKIPLSDKEQAGVRLLACWDGKAAVNVYRYDADALLMERAVGEGSLRRMVLDGREDEANTIICTVVEQLHANGCAETGGLVPLASWFASLAGAAATHGGMFTACHAIADALLSDPQDLVALHGDIHYDNILDSGSRGWVAIDPKGLIGERGFDFANLFCNPDISVASAPGRLSRQAGLIARLSGIEPSRLLRWIIAWSGLMAAWMLEDGEEPTLPLLAAELAAMELEN